MSDWNDRSRVGGVHRGSAIRVNGRADNAPRVGGGQPRGCPAAAAEARGLAAVVVDVLVLLVLERLRGPLALARTRPIALKPNQTAAISTTRISSFIGLNMSHAPVTRHEPRGDNRRRAVLFDGHSEAPVRAGQAFSSSFPQAPGARSARLATRHSARRAVARSGPAARPPFKFHTILLPSQLTVGLTVGRRAAIVRPVPPDTSAS